MNVELIEPPALTPDTLAVIADALVPLFWWPDVPVLRDLHRDLTALELFVLETGLSLGAVTAPEFAEITSLPEEVLGGIAADLVAAGALRPGGGGYAVVPEVAGPAVKSRTLPRRTHATAGFVFLPRHGDLLGLPSDHGWLADLERHRPRPVTGAPLPPALWAATRDRYIAERHRAGTITGPVPDIAAIVVDAEDSALVPSTGRDGAGTCPAYRCRAVVRSRPGGEPAVEAVFRGEPAGAAASADASSPAAAADAAVEVAADLTGADGLVRDWTALSESLTEPVTLAAAWRRIVPATTERPPYDIRRLGGAEWELGLNLAAASAVAAQGHDLSRPIGLAIAADAAVVHLACRFRPADTEAQVLFR